MNSDIRPRIESTNAQFVSAFKRGDAAGIANLYTEGAQLLPAHSDFVRGTAAICTFWQSVIDTGLKGASLETIELETHGDRDRPIPTFYCRRRRCRPGQIHRRVEA